MLTEFQYRINGIIRFRRLADQDSQAYYSGCVIMASHGIVCFVCRFITKIQKNSYERQTIKKNRNNKSN